MPKKTINLLFVVDDSQSDCRFTEIIAKKSEVVSEVIVNTDPTDALRYLKTANRKQPDVILLDINMPKLNGFRFADAYQELYEELKQGTKLVIVTNSLNPEDRKRAEAHPSIDGFSNKPTSIEDFLALADLYGN